jgi:hypothetical protein
MVMLPTKHNDGQPGIFFLLLSASRNPFYSAGNSHGEWVEKTTRVGSNWETFCFDYGGLT